MYTDHQTELLHIASEQALSSDQFQQLQSLTAWQTPLATQSAWFRRVLLILAGMFLGLAVIFWVAANWDNFTTFHKFALVEVALGASLLAGSLPSRIRSAALLLAVLILGGLLALYAQVYSTGADPWRLFAIWAAMALPIALAARHQVVWLFWWLVVLLATMLWLGQFGHIGELSEAWPVWAAWGILLLFAGALYPRGLLKQWLGSSAHHAFRWAVCGALITILLTTLFKGFSDYWWVFALLSLGIFAGIAYGLYVKHYADRVISAVSVLCVDAVLIAMWVKGCVDTQELDRYPSVTGWMFVTLVAGIASLVLLGLSVKLLKKIHRSYQVPGGAA